MTKRVQKQGITYNLLPTKQFKSTRIHISFGNKLSRDTVTERALLPYLLRAISSKYPSRNVLNEKVENMYAAQFSGGSNKIGQSHFINFDINIIDDAYTIDNESLLVEALEFLNEIIFNPLLTEDILQEEKRLMDEYFLSIYNNKLRYAIRKLIKQMFIDEPFSISPMGHQSSLQQITLDDCKKAYHDMLHNDVINISVVGDFDPVEMTTLLDKHLPFKNRTQKLELLEYGNKKITEVTNTFVTQDVTQSKLVLGYRSEIRYMDEDYYPMMLFNQILGGSADSLLHNRIREELSLVYFISSSYSIYKGALFIYAGINYSDYQNTLDEIDNIITSIQNGELEDIHLDIAKKSIMNSIIESFDSNYSLAMKIESQNLFIREKSLEEVKELVQSITKEDIERVANAITLDTTLCLKGDNDE